MPLANLEAPTARHILTRELSNILVAELPQRVRRATHLPGVGRLAALSARAATLFFGTLPPFALAIALVMRLAAFCVIGVPLVVTVEPLLFDIELSPGCWGCSAAELEGAQGQHGPKIRK